MVDSQYDDEPDMESSEEEQDSPPEKHSVPKATETSASLDLLGAGQPYKKMNN